MQRFIIILFCLASTGTVFAASSIEELQRLLEQKRFAAAAIGGEQLLRENPRDLRARFLTAYAYQSNAQTDQAIALYQEIIDENPALPEPYNNLAIIYLAQGDYDRASQALVDAINTHSSYATAYENLSRVYKGIASEAYRRAVNESSEPSKYTHNIELAVISKLEFLDQGRVTEDSETEQTLITFANQETLLIEQVKRWAQAWSNKDFAAYTSFYDSQHVADFRTHEAWVAHRRKRIMRPGSIKIEVSNIQVKWRSENRAIIDFKQVFDSPGYSDRVRKRLGFNRLGTEWKITEERVLSVL